MSEKFRVHRKQTECAEGTGIKHYRLSRFATGELFPRADEAVRIEEELEIPVSWWNEPVVATPPDPDPAPSSAAE